MFEIIIMAISFISLYLSLFWISLFYVEQDDIKKNGKLSQIPSVSILIPAYNEEKVIAGTLKSILKADYPKNKLEVIVINDGSTDKTGEIVSAFKNVKLINKKNGGKATALNLGLKHAKGEIIGVVDADSIVTRNALKLMIPSLYDPKTAAVISGLKVYKPKNLLQRLQHFEYLFTTFLRRLMASIDTLYITPGALSLYKKEILLKAGGFAVGNMTEDLEMGMKLHSKYYNIKSQLNAITYTKVPSRIGKFYRQRIRWCRGLFENIYKYKYMLFNKKYDTMGMFQLPVLIFVPILLFIFLSVVGYEAGHSFHEFLIAFDVLKLKAISIFPGTTLKMFLLGIKSVRFFVIPIFLSGLFILSKAQKNLKEKWKYPLTVLIFFTAYQIFLSSYWLISVFYELLGVKKKW